jgi:protein-L-isoaspartate(D-aspartate) O-methyltransferase
VTDTPFSPWQQLTYTCDDWRAAENTAVAVLGPLLTTAQDKGDIASWWFIRKGPEWRVRLESPAGNLTGRLAEALAVNGDARSVTEGTYEPETTRFGGPDAMDAAHRLFAADSRRLLDHLARNSPRLLREIPVILAARLLRAARQDWYEQGDCWEQMAAHRRDGHGPAPEPDPGTVSAMLALLSAGGDAPGSPLDDRPEWASAFEDAGRQIAALAGRGVSPGASARCSPSTCCSSSTATASPPPTSNSWPLPPARPSSAGSPAQARRSTPAGPL